MLVGVIEGTKVYVYRGVPSMPDIMTLPGKLLVRKDTEAYYRLLKILKQS